MTHQHDSIRNGGGAFERGLAEIRTGRRTLLAGAAAGAAAGVAVSAIAAPAGAALPAATDRRAYVLVVDGTRPEELDLGVTPRLKALRDAGRRFARAQSLPIMETIPNHVMMMTGVRPALTGVPANSVYDAVDKVVRDMDRDTDIKVTTVIEQLNAAGHTTATVLSKEYLYGVFGGRATYRWEPFPTLPITKHAPDVATIDAAIAMVDGHDPHFMFVNLGDIDRFGHGDVTGTTLQAARHAALADTDAQVGRFVDLLHAKGLWERSLVIVLADHSMDWSTPDHVVSLAAVLEKDPLLAGKVQYADNGGADLLYWTGAATDRPAAVRRMAELALATKGVLEVHRPADLQLGAHAGDLVAFCKAGWRFSDPQPTSNPIPGNHGHPATRPIPLFLSGGVPGLVRRGVSASAAATIDVAPTIGAFFGVAAPRTGWQGKPLIRP